MVSEIEKTAVRIKEMKQKMGELWEQRRTTDQEILLLSIEIDTLLNEYQRLVTDRDI